MSPWTGSERRLHLQAFNLWSAVAEGRAFPRLRDFRPEDVRKFRENSFVVDFSTGVENPRVVYAGLAIEQEAGAPVGDRPLVDLPTDSVLNHLCLHYLEVLANKAPIGFEAEYAKRDGSERSYRGVLMPLSDDGSHIHLIYGVVNWMTGIPMRSQYGAGANMGLASKDPAVQPDHPDQTAPHVPEQIPAEVAQDSTRQENKAARAEPAEPIASSPAPAKSTPSEIASTDGADFAKALSKAKAALDNTTISGGRSRSALYEALSWAYASYTLASKEPESYSQALASAGLRTQARAPFTPLVKLVFGRDYDKTRIAEYAATLSYADRNQIAPEALNEFIQETPGGIKGCVSAERAAKRAAAGTLDQRNTAEGARELLRKTASIASSIPDTTDGDEEFLILVGRRSSPKGGIDIVAALDEPSSRIDPILKRAVRTKDKPAP